MSTGADAGVEARRILRRAREDLEDVQFVTLALVHWADDVRRGRAPQLLREHWWARVVELPDIARRVLREIERVVARRRHRRRARVSAWRERVLQLALPLEW